MCKNARQMSPNARLQRVNDLSQKALLSLLPIATVNSPWIGGKSQFTLRSTGLGKSASRQSK